MDINDFLSDLLKKDFKKNSKGKSLSHKIDAIKTVSDPIPDTDYELDTDQKELFDLVENTNTNVFIQGQAGTGKSTFINYLKKYSDKQLLLSMLVEQPFILYSNYHSLIFLSLMTC